MTKRLSWHEIADICDGQWLTESPTDDEIRDITTDSRALRPGALFVALPGERFDGHNFLAQAAEAGAAAAIVSRPMDSPLPCLLVKDTLRAYQELAGAWRAHLNNLLVIGITGSSGKTSSKEMITAVMRAHFGTDAVLCTEGNTNNQIGLPSNLLRLTPGHRCAVLEMGTNSHGEIPRLREVARPQIAVLTNIGPVHLEGLGSLDGVAREKSAIFAGVELAVLPKTFADNPIVRAALPAKTVTTGFEATADIRVAYQGSDLTHSRFSLEGLDASPVAVEWTLRGRHMALNAAAAAAIARHLGMAPSALGRALAGCVIPGMRMKFLEIDGVTWINDAYNANPDSMRALLDWLAEAAEGRPLVVVLGDMLELGPDSERLHQTVLQHARRCLPKARLVAVGRWMHACAGAVDAVGCQDIAAAQATLKQLIRPGDCVALKGSRGMALERLLPQA